MGQPGTCPVCKKPFAGGEDIVTCPSCGAPYHRACYQKAGQCLFTSKHGTGFEYQTEPSAPKMPPKENAADAGTKVEGIRCHQCGTINDASNIFCERCGTPLHQNFSADAGRNATAGGYGTGAVPPPAGMGAQGYAPPLDTAGTIDGIDKKDWAAFIGPSAPTYLYRLSAQEARGSKFTFMFSAFFVGPFFFAYRKMWGWAAASLLVLTALAVPGYLDVFRDAAIPQFAALSADTLGWVATLTSYISFGLQLLIGFFALYLYRRQAGKKIRALKEQALPPQDYQQALGQKGGVSGLGVAVMLAVYVALYVVVYMNFGQYLAAYFSLA